MELTWRSWFLPCLGALCLLGACAGDDDSGDTAAAGSASRTASQQGTSGGVADYDGDGFADLFVGAPYARGGSRVGAVFVHRGDGTGFAAEPTWTLGGDDNFGYRFAAVGDLDGDGFGDYAVTALNGDGADASLCGSVTVYRGGSGGQVLARLAGEQAMDKFGYSVTGGCDLDGDGFGDLVVGAIAHSPSPAHYLGGAVYIYFGPDFAAADRLKLGATDHTGILGFSSACGDLNGDALDDLVLSAIWTHGVRWHSSQVLGFYGGAGFAPEVDAADLTVTSSASHFGDGLAVLDDLDGDGYGEVAIGVPSFYAIPRPFPHHTGTVHLVRGGTGTRTVDLAAAGGDLLTTLYGTDTLERFGSVLAPLGDLDGDGLPELAVSALHADADGAVDLETGRVTGKVYVFFGADLATDGSATPASAAVALGRNARDLHYGSFLTPYDEHGEARLLVGAPTADRQDGTVYVETLPTRSAP